MAGLEACEVSPCLRHADINPAEDEKNGLFPEPHCLLAYEVCLDWPQSQTPFGRLTKIYLTF